MNEKGFWENRVRPALHRPPTCVAWKVQDQFNRGLPDVDVCVDGVAAKLELKYVPKVPVRPTTAIKVDLSIEQRRRLFEWQGAGGNAGVVLGVDKLWFLLYPEMCAPCPVEALKDRALAWGTDLKHPEQQELLRRSLVRL